MANSAENIKRSSVEAADEQLREIKRLHQEESKTPFISTPPPQDYKNNGSAMHDQSASLLVTPF